jgi:hypothetical protein
MNQLGNIQITLNSYIIFNCQHTISTYIQLIRMICTYIQLIRMICIQMGTVVAQWLRYCATNQKVAGSIQSASGSER